MEHCCFGHSQACDSSHGNEPQHTPVCQLKKFRKNKGHEHPVHPWITDPLIFHRFEFLKKFKSFKRFLKRGAPYIELDKNKH